MLSRVRRQPGLPGQEPSVAELIDVDREYRDRAEPFINLLLEYLDQSVPEQRTHMPASTIRRR